MTRRFLTLAVLFVFVAGSGLATAEEVLRSSVRNHAGPADADSCPDPGTDGQPCGPTCLCLCCPGHANGLAVFVPRPTVGIPPSTELEIEAHDDLRPKGVLHRIFRPPRS
jgi:hypothetical protein